MGTIIRLLGKTDENDENEIYASFFCKDDIYRSLFILLSENYYVRKITSYNNNTTIISYNKDKELNTFIDMNYKNLSFYGIKECEDIETISKRIANFCKTNNIGLPVFDTGVEPYIFQNANGIEQKCNDDIDRILKYRRNTIHSYTIYKYIGDEKEKSTSVFIHNELFRPIVESPYSQIVYSNYTNTYGDTIDEAFSDFMKSQIPIIKDYIQLLKQEIDKLEHIEKDIDGMDLNEKRYYLKTRLSEYNDDNIK